MDDATLLGLDDVSGDPDPALVDRLRALIARDSISAEDAPAASALTLVPSLVAVVPDALDRHRSEGIAHDLTLATLQDVGRKHRLYGAHTVVPWLLGILRGDVVAVGRLQVERRAGAHGHALHVPETGPLVPLGVDAALLRAEGLTQSRQYSCTSWLLDPLLVAELPESNIAAFARRFEVRAIPPDQAASEAVCKFVFGKPLADVLNPRAVEPRSRLQHLVAARLRSGAHWSEPVGVLSA